MLKVCTVVLVTSATLLLVNRSISGYIFFDQLYISESPRVFFILLTYSYLFVNFKVLTA